MRDLAISAHEAIEQLPEIRELFLLFKAAQLQPLFDSMTEKGLDDAHPFAPELQKIYKVFDDAIILLSTSISIEAIRNIERERVYFNASRVRANTKSREAMQRLRDQRKTGFKNLNDETETAEAISIDFDSQTTNPKAKMPPFYSYLINRYGHDTKISFTQIHNNLEAKDLTTSIGFTRSLLESLIPDDLAVQHENDMWEIK